MRPIAGGISFQYDQGFQTDIHQPGSDPYKEHDFWTHTPAFQEVNALVTLVESPNDSPMTSPGEIMRGQQTYMTASVRRVAKNLSELLSHTKPEILSSGKGVKIRSKRFDPAKGFWVFQAAGSKGENYTIRVKGVMTPKIKSLEKAQIQVSCTCDFFMWQGPEHWAKANNFLYGKPRGTATNPAEKDPKGQNWICKHVAAALEMARRFKFSSSSRGGELERWSYDGEIIAMPDPSRVVLAYEMSSIQFTFKPDKKTWQEGFSVSATHPEKGVIGLLTAFEMDTSSPAIPDDIYRSEFTGDLFPEAHQDFLRAAQKIGRGARAFGVSTSWIHKLFRGEGLGQSLYKIMIYELAKRKAVLVPNSAYEGGGTSTSAQRVWKLLSREGVQMTGQVAWGGSLGPEVYSPPHTKRKHGFPPEPGYQRQRVRDEIESPE